MPIPRTAAQAEAARRNGSLSRGPVSAEGRARSVQSGTRHGLASGEGTFRLLPGEDPEAWRAHLAALDARHAPADPAERHWVEQIACAAWRQRRLLDLEGRVMAAALSVNDGPEAGVGGSPPALPSLATLARYGGRIERDLRLAEAQPLALRRSRPRADGTPAPAPLGLAEVRALLARGEEEDARALARGGEGGWQERTRGRRRRTRSWSPPGSTSEPTRAGESRPSCGSPAQGGG